MKKPPKRKRRRRRDTELVPGDILALRHRRIWLTLWVLSIEPGRTRGTYPCVTTLGNPTKTPRTEKQAVRIQTMGRRAFLFELKDRELAGSHAVIAFRAVPPAARPYSIGGFCCATEKLTLDALARG